MGEPLSPMTTFAATVHRRRVVDDAVWIYASSSAAVLRLDAVADAVLGAFLDGPKSVDAALAAAAASPGAEGIPIADLATTLRELVGLGLVRPLGESAPPAPTVPPMPYPLTTLVVNVTNACNLSCTYCYEYGEDRLADRERTDGTARRSTMTVETARESVDFLFANSEGRPEITVTFFGGETLLNWTVIEAAVAHAEARAKAEGRKVNFSLTTNATLLTDAIIDFLVDHTFGINISIDGAAEDHDRHRKFKSGEGSYELILPKIRRLLETNRARRGRPIGARVTLTRGTRDVRGLFRHLTEDLGFDEVGLAPVTAAKDRDWAFEPSDYHLLVDAFGALADDYVEAATAGRHHGFSNLSDLLRELHTGTNKAHPCGAGLGLLGVSTEGDLGLCHRFVESGEHEIGSISEGIDATKRAAFLDAGHISKRLDCHGCFARPVCSGGCYHEAYVRTGDASAPNLHACDWIRAWTDIGLSSYARIMAKNPAWFDRHEVST